MVMYKFAKTTSIVVGSLLAAMTLFSQTRPLLYAAVDVQRGSAHAAEMKELAAHVDQLDKLRDDELVDLREDLLDTRQAIACVLWKVPARECRDFKIPVPVRSR